MENRIGYIEGRESAKVHIRLVESNSNNRSRSKLSQLKGCGADIKYINKNYESITQELCEYGNLWYKVCNKN